MCLDFGLEVRCEAFQKTHRVRAAAHTRRQSSRRRGVHRRLRERTLCKHFERCSTNVFACCGMCVVLCTCDRTYSMVCLVVAFFTCCNERFFLSSAGYCLANSGFLGSHLVHLHRFSECLNERGFAGLLRTSKCSAVVSQLTR